MAEREKRLLEAAMKLYDAAVEYRAHGDQWGLGKTLDEAFANFRKVKKELYYE